jgi:sigma-B regulation protein RsbU (phosphoserine phosphatase)
MATVIDDSFRAQLLERRERLQVTAPSAMEGGAELARLLREVDAALSRMDNGSYGLCEVCHDPIEAERLLADPLVRFCLGDLTAQQQEALAEDLELAVHIQRGLLPPRDLDAGAWKVAYHYEPVGFVGGDYCDLIKTDGGDLYFILGDVSGKGMAASLLMSNLQAMFRALVPLGLSLDKLMERASRLFCENTLSTHFATLVCGKASETGEVELCNAGHLPPILIREGERIPLDSTGLPVGMFCDEQFATSKLQLAPGDALLLYTDGVTEALDLTGAEYGVERLLQSLDAPCPSRPAELIDACVSSLADFRGDGIKADDLTLMALKFAA